MTDMTLTAELLQALEKIQLELKQMNSTLSLLAKNRQTSGETASRPVTGKSPRTGKPFRSEKSESDLDKAPGFRGGFSARKSPARPKGKLPAKKGGGYPKKSARS